MKTYEIEYIDPLTGEPCVMRMKALGIIEAITNLWTNIAALHAMTDRATIIRVEVVE